MQVIHTTRNGKPILLFFPLFRTIACDRYILIQTLVITLLCNVMLTVPREVGLPVLTATMVDASTMVRLTAAKTR